MMKKYYSLALFILLFLAGCAAPDIEDPSSLQREGFKKYERPDIYIDDALPSQPPGQKKQTVSKAGSKRPQNPKPGSKEVKDTTPRLEWIPGPDKDTTWEQARVVTS